MRRSLALVSAWAGLSVPLPLPEALKQLLDDSFKSKQRNSTILQGVAHSTRESNSSDKTLVYSAEHHSRVSPVSPVDIHDVSLNLLTSSLPLVDETTALKALKKLVPQVNAWVQRTAGDGFPVPLGLEELIQRNALSNALCRGWWQYSFALLEIGSPVPRWRQALANQLLDATNKLTLQKGQIFSDECAFELPIGGFLVRDKALEKKKGQRENADVKYPSCSCEQCSICIESKDKRFVEFQSTYEKLDEERAPENKPSNVFTRIQRREKASRESDACDTVQKIAAGLRQQRPKLDDASIRKMILRYPEGKQLESINAQAFLAFTDRRAVPLTSM